MPRKSRKKQQESQAIEPVEVAVAEIEEPQAEAAPPKRELIRQPTGPRGKWSEGWARVVDIGPGKVRFRVVPSFNQCQIKFDEECKPDTATKAMLMDEGWQYRASEKLWYYKRDREHQNASTLGAEEFYRTLVDHLRGKNGLDPTIAV
jgi:hypothetical protein